MHVETGQSSPASQHDNEEAKQTSPNSMITSSKDVSKRLSFGIDQILSPSSVSKKSEEVDGGIQNGQPFQENDTENKSKKRQECPKLEEKNGLKTIWNDGVATCNPLIGEVSNCKLANSHISNVFQVKQQQSTITVTTESRSKTESSTTSHSRFSIDSLISPSQIEAPLSCESPAYHASYASVLLAGLRSGVGRPAVGGVLQGLHNGECRHAGDYHGILEHPLLHWPLTQRDRFGVVRRIGHPYQNRTPPKRKKPRTSFSRAQIVELEKRFHRQKYLASAERSSLAKQLKMTDAQVKTWFQNRRTKWRRQTAEEREIERQATQKFLLSLRTEEKGPIFTPMRIPPPSPTAPRLPVNSGRGET